MAQSSTSSLPSGLQELLNKCREYGADVTQQLVEERRSGIHYAGNHHDEFFLRPNALSRSADCTSNQLPSLYPHQVEGIRWLMALFKTAVNGILADDMGLGKTVQVIGFLSALYGQCYFGTHLIVVPLSTLDNWRQELASWCPWLPVVVFHGTKEKRQGLREWLRKRYRSSWKHQAAFSERSEHRVESVESLVKDVGCVVLTTYDMVMIDHAALCKLIPWDLLIVDEAHRLKNFNCKLLQCLRKCQAEGRLLLTGTPLQNNVKELWSTLNFVVPQLFSDVDVFAGWFEQAELVATPTSTRTETFDVDQEPSNNNNGALLCNSGATASFAVYAAGKSSVPIAGGAPTIADVTAVVQQLHEALRPFLLRRTKADLTATAELRLPLKVEVVIYAPLVPLQVQLYNAMKSSDAFANNRLMHLRKLCNHPKLFPDATIAQLLSSNDKSLARRKATSSNETRQGDVVTCGATPLQRLTTFLRGSAKFTVLDKMLRHLLSPKSLYQPQHKLLIFSQMTKVLDLIEEYFELLKEVAASGCCASRKVNQRTAISHDVFFQVKSWVRLDGTSPLDDRVRSIDEFNEGGHGNKKRPREESVKGNVKEGIVDDLCVFESPPPRLRKLHSSDAQQQQLTNADRSLKDPSTGKTDTLDGMPSSPSVFLISTRSGGVGLNLTAADTVILFDCDFNPHNDQQAIDRCHRIGQSRPVAVYRIVSPNTVEEALLCVALRKKKMEALVIGCGDFSTQAQEAAPIRMVKGGSVQMASQPNNNVGRITSNLARFLLDESSLSIINRESDIVHCESEAAACLARRPNASSSTSGTREERLIEALTMRMSFGHCHDGREATTDADLAALMHRGTLVALHESSSSGLAVAFGQKAKQ